jgi:hypothetical protein
MLLLLLLLKKVAKLLPSYGVESDLCSFVPRIEPGRELAKLLALEAKVLLTFQVDSVRGFSATL